MYLAFKGLVNPNKKILSRFYSLLYYTKPVWFSVFCKKTNKQTKKTEKFWIQFSIQ